jgi:hypothetical protein
MAPPGHTNVQRPVTARMGYNAWTGLYGFADFERDHYGEAGRGCGAPSQLPRMLVRELARWRARMVGHAHRNRRRAMMVGWRTPTTCF